MSIKLKDLITIFPRRADVARVLGITRQAISATPEFTNIDRVNALEKATVARMKEMKKALKNIKAGAKKAREKSGGTN